MYASVYVCIQVCMSVVCMCVYMGRMHTHTHTHTHKPTNNSLVHASRMKLMIARQLPQQVSLLIVLQAYIALDFPARTFLASLIFTLRQTLYDLLGSFSEACALLYVCVCVCEYMNNM